MDSYMVSNGSCTMVIWTNFKNHLLEVVVPQNREPTALQTLTPVGLFYFIRCEDPQLTCDWGPSHIWVHTTLESPWPHYMSSEVSWTKPLDTFVWALTISWSRLLARVWSGPKHNKVGTTEPSVMTLEEVDFCWDPLTWLPRIQSQPLSSGT